MRTNKISVDGVYLFIVPEGFAFVRQNCVKFYGKRLSKAELIKCCHHYISELQILYSPERLKIGFNLKCFKYYELSVYLHGLVSLYCSKLELHCPSCFGLSVFSHLPHEVFNPEKVKRNLEISLVKDFFGGSYYVCSINGTSISFHSLQGLKPYLYLKFPSLRDYDIDFIVK